MRRTSSSTRGSARTHRGLGVPMSGFPGAFPRAARSFLAVGRSSLIILFSSAPLSAQVVFVDVAPQTGTADIGYGKATAMVDLDGDGNLDLIATNSGNPDRVFRQVSATNFVDVTTAWGFALEPLETYAVLVADFDEDADNDVYLVTGGHSAQQPNRLYRNDLNQPGARFNEVGGISAAGFTSQAFGGTALDYDLDGDLDILVSNAARFDLVGGCRLLRNDGGMLFVDNSVPSGVPAAGDFRHASSGDYDNDGWPDAGVGFNHGPSALLRNNANGTFSNLAATASVDWVGPNFGMVFEDLDQDGWMDILLARYQPIVVNGPSGLFLNRGDGTFQNVSVASGMGAHSDMGHSLYDVDADGFCEAYFGTGAPSFAAPDVFYAILPSPITGLVATDISLASGVAAGPWTRGHGSAFGDYDRDGDIDMYLGLGGMGQLPATAEPNRLMQNQGNGRHHLSIRPTGVLSSHTAVGLRGTVTTMSGRLIHRHMTVGKGFGNTDDHILHFGLGDESAINRVELFWPSGVRQTLFAAAVDTERAVTEAGLRILGTPAPGASVTLQACGASGDVAELFLSAQTAMIPVPQVQGYFGLGVPFIGPVALPLQTDSDGTGGVASLNLTIPSIPSLSGQSVFLQSWNHPQGTTSGSFFTDVLQLTIL